MPDSPGQEAPKNQEGAEKTPPREAPPQESGQVPAGVLGAASPREVLQELAGGRRPAEPEQVAEGIALSLQVVTPEAGIASKDEWRAWLLQTPEFRDKLTGAEDADRAAILMERFSEGMRYIAELHPTMQIPRVSFIVGQQGAEQVEGVSYFRGQNMIGITARHLLEYVLLLNELGDPTEPIILDREDGTVVFEGTVGEEMLFTAMEETSHAAYFQENYPSGTPLPPFLDPLTTPPAEYDAQPHELLSLQERLTYATEHSMTLPANVFAARIAAAEAVQSSQGK